MQNSVSALVVWSNVGLSCSNMYQSAVKESKNFFFIEDSKFENKHAVSRSLRFVSSHLF